MKYTSQCNQCGKQHNYASTISTRNKTPICCNAKTSKIINTPMIASTTARPFENYKCPHSNELITSDKSRRNVMAKHNLIEAKPI